MNRLSRQLAASSRFFRCTNGSVARKTVFYPRYSTKKPDSPPQKDAKSEPPPSSELWKAIDQHVEAQSSEKKPKSIPVDNVDQLLEALESQAGQEALQKLPDYVTGEFNHLISNVLLQTGEGDVRVMHAIADMLSSSSSTFKLEVTVPLPDAPVAESRSRKLFLSESFTYIL
ncbi:hypothetical protein GYMLUDRAFT_948034 [Collybiopsis luxurians FD-317 M1]|uniref:Uncharacterized protein n=1 Tax=Collybiopsis luxurians FD-317 M1 TaxID=944289 RepID=A0A0D0C510_9AGAR|nr:hypothetical protein GYMLUDRAFT_948034 [Collybiopsis luxurians FD-317 M1]